MEHPTEQQKALFIEQSRKDNAPDDLEIDDNPAISACEDGCWVAAWVWVGNDAI